MILTKVINLKLTDEQKKEIENLQSQKYTTKKGNSSCLRGHTV